MMIDENQEYLKISIVTVVFNGAKTLEQTMLSVVNQTYKNIEYIIIDGGSTDETVDLIRKYENRVAYWVSEADNGIYDAMNKGIDKCSGDYIYFLGDDDFLVDKEIIGIVARNLSVNYDADVLCGSVWVVNEKLKLQIEYTNKFKITDLYKGYCIPHQGLFVRSNLMKRLLFSTKYDISADREFFYKIYFSDKIVFKFIDIKIAYFSNEGISASHISKRVQEDIEIMNLYSIPKESINQYEKLNQSFMDQAKNLLRLIFTRYYFFRFIFKNKGWKEHKCNWDFCRLCVNHKNGDNNEYF